MKEILTNFEQNITVRWIFSFYCLALVCTDLIPNFGGIDLMGAQWLYLAIVNSIFLCLFFLKGFPLKRGRNTVIVIYGVYILFCLISIITAINKVESTVVLSRYLIVFITVLLIYQFGNLADNKVRKILGWIIALVCLAQSLSVMYTLYIKAKATGFHNVNLHNLILYDFTFSQGNKNITASNLVQKMPFILFLVFGEAAIGKIVGYTSLLLASIAMFILGSISAVGGLALFIVLTNMFVILYKIRTRKYILKVLFIDAVLIIVILFTGICLQKLSLGNVQNYKSITERFIGKTERNFDSERRKLMLSQGWEYLKAHPFTGCGLGNWKIVAISFDKYLFDDFRIAKHVHNDFVESAAETGFVGGILYITLFTFLIYVLVSYLKKQNQTSAKLFNLEVLVLLSALGVYIIDALFNFPSERPCNQVNLTLIIGFTAALHTRNSATKKMVPRCIFFSFVVVVIIFALYSTFMVFRSMKYQEYFKDDVWLSNPQIKAANVDSALPNYPNLTEFALPVNCIKARYYLFNNNEKDALMLLKSIKDPNPNIALKDDLLAEYYATKNCYDSSFLYAKKAITALPRCRLYAKVFLFNCLEKNDSNSISNYFTNLISHSPTLFLATDWENYCSYYYQCTGNKEKVMKLLDSALLACRNNKRLVELKSKITDEINNQKQCLSPDSMAQYHHILTEARKNYLKYDYNAAIWYFNKAIKFVPNDYSIYENLGLVYFQKKDFKQCIFYFKMVIDSRKFKNGRSEYYCANAYFSLNNLNDACKYVTLAVERKYPGATELKKICCYR